jgi:hypothetical protein
VPATSATFLAFFLFFLLWLLTVLMKQTRQAVCAIKQSILLRCLWCSVSVSNFQGDQIGQFFDNWATIEAHYDFLKI